MMHTSTPAPLAPLAAVLALLTAAGFRTVEFGTYRGRNQVWFDGPAGVAGLHGTLYVGRTSGQLTGAEILPTGETAPATVEIVRGGRAVADRLAELLAPAPAVAEDVEDIDWTMFIDPDDAPRDYENFVPQYGAPMAELLAEYCAA